MNKLKIDWQRARDIMGKNFFGIEDWATLYGANFSQKQLREVAEFPWSEDILNSTCPLCGKTVKDCHFAFLGLDRLNGKPLTILKFQELYPVTAQPRFASYISDSWYSEEKFVAETTMSLRWYLLHTNIVPKSEDKTFDEQKAMLPAEYEVPSAIAEVSKDLLVFKKTGVYANSSRYGWCIDLFSGGCRVRVGIFIVDGLHVNGFGDESRDHSIGVATSRKLNQSFPRDRITTRERLRYFFERLLGRLSGLRQRLWPSPHPDGLLAGYGHGLISARKF